MPPVQAVELHRNVSKGVKYVLLFTHLDTTNVATSTLKECVVLLSDFLRTNIRQLGF